MSVWKTQITVLLFLIHPVFFIDKYINKYKYIFGVNRFNVPRLNLF